MSTRADQLRKMLEKTPGDAFLLYGLALEHKKAGEIDDALALLAQTTAADPNYAYAYFQRGQIFESQEKIDDAKAAYRDGVAAATRAGDAHGQSEIQGALESLD
jgi:tetratricopeptide (TPR) repeat protein